MHELVLEKPDGRVLSLYSRTAIHVGAVEGAVEASSLHPNPELRWHPLRGEWVAYAAHRQQRTFLPPPQHDPLRPSSDPTSPTELPAGDYEIAVFDNLFPSMCEDAAAPAPQIVEVGVARGRCEVVVFTQEADGSLSRLPLGHIELLIEVWARRTQVLRTHPHIRYVLAFENRGAEVGVTLHHPHGQIYAYPFVPPVPLRMQMQELAHFAAHGRSLLETLIEAETNAAKRIIHPGEHAVAFVPAWARYPYEVWIAPRAAVPDFASLSSLQRADLARAIKLTLSKYDRLWGFPMPYIMAWYQAPFDGTPPGAYHLHAECWPAFRMKGRLKYLAGTEVAAGTFVNDTYPEEKARELQAVSVTDLES
jgi:UDPglucose--hexose-1-phosphate uridylyltransferase